MAHDSLLDNLLREVAAIQNLLSGLGDIAYTTLQVLLIIQTVSALPAGDTLRCGPRIVLLPALLG